MAHIIIRKIKIRIQLMLKTFLNRDFFIYVVINVVNHFRRPLVTYVQNVHNAREFISRAVAQNPEDKNCLVEKKLAASQHKI